MSPFKSTLLALLLLPFTVFSQLPSQTTIDSEPKPDSYVLDAEQDGENAYICGISSNACSETPFVSKISITTGELLWSTNQTTTANDDVYRKAGDIEVIGDFVYAICDIGWYSDTAKFWKINENTGAILWKAFFPKAGFQHDYSIHPYSSTHLVIHSAQMVYLVNLETGKFEKSFEDNYDRFMGVGLNQDVFVDFKKYQNFDFSAPVNLTKPTSNVCSASSGPTKVFPVDDNTILGFSVQGCETSIFMMDHQQNKILWNLDGAANSDYMMSDFKLKGKYLYVTYQSLYVGGFTVKIIASKIDITTGHLEWRSSNLYSNQYNVSNPLDHHFTEGNAYSIDVDDAGDVYLTGSANSQSIDADMGIMKLSGITGEKLFDKIITEDQSDFDYASNGLLAVVYNNAPYFIGNVATNSFYTLPNDQGHVTSGNNIALVKINPQTAVVEARHNYTGNKVESSEIKQIITYQTQDLLVLETRGRYMYLSRYDKNQNPVWSKQLKHKIFYSQTAVKMAVDKKGNIAILSHGFFMSKYADGPGGANKDMILMLNDQGSVINELMIPAISDVADLLCDGDSFFAMSGTSSSSRTDLYKFDATGTLATQQFDLSQSSWNPQRKMAETSNNQIVMIDQYMKLATINKADFSVSFDNHLVDYLKAWQPTDMIIRNDTLYTIGYQPHEGFYSMTCYSLLAKKILWQGPVVSASYGGYYKKIIFDAYGNLYAFGVGQYQGFLLRKINRLSGQIVWEQLRTYDNDLEGTDIFYDQTRNQIITTGYKRVSAQNKYFTAGFDVDYGSLKFLNIDDAISGSGITIGQVGNGDIVTGGYSTSDPCVQAAIYVNYVPSMSAPQMVMASEGLEEFVTVSWTTESAAWFMVYRSLFNSASTAQAVSSWINASSYNDLSAVRATGYYYFLQKAKDSSGTGVSILSAGDYGYRGLTTPVIGDVQVDHTKKISITWDAVEGAGFYRVFRGTVDDKDQAEMLSGWITATNFIDSTAQGKTDYYFVQAAKDGDGHFATPLSDGFNAQLIAGIEDGGLNAGITYYPNPFINHITIKYHSPFTGMVHISLVDLLGNEVMKLMISKNDELLEKKIDLSTLTSGYYLLLVKEGQSSNLEYRIKVLKGS